MTLAQINMSNSIESIIGAHELKIKNEKNYKIIWTDGYRFRIHVTGANGVKELEADGFWFDDFFDDGTGDELWKR